MTRTKQNLPVAAEQTPQWDAQLSDRERRFVEEYIIDLNGMSAALRAGLGKTPASAASMASRMRRKGTVAAAISALMNERTGTTASRVVEELGKLAFSRATDIVRVENGRVVVTDTDQLSEDDLAAVAEISETVGENGRTIKVRFHDKLGALDKLAKVLAMYEKRPVDPRSAYQPVDDAENIRQRISDMFKRIAERAQERDRLAAEPEIQPPLRRLPGPRE